MASEGTDQVHQNTLFDIGDLEVILGYNFHDRDLLREAMTHASYSATRNYERLEFLGDSVLNCLVAREMMACYPELQPGQLTRLRVVNVDTEKLGRVAMKHHLYRYVLHKAPPLVRQVEDFGKAIQEYPSYSSGLIDTPNFLADIVESLLGAVTVDCNYCLDTVWEVFKVFLEPVTRLDSYKEDPTSELQEFCQKRGWKVKFEDTWRTDKRIAVTIMGHYVGSAQYPHRRDTAHKRATKAALDNLMASSSLRHLLDREKEAREMAERDSA